MNLINKILLASMFLLLSIASFSNLAFADDYQFPNIKVVADEISPEPVEPGQDLTVKVRVINDGDDSAQGVNLRLNSEYPFFLKTESYDISGGETLCVGCSLENTYYLVVDANAKSGIYPLNFEILRGDVVVKPSNIIDVKVVGKPDFALKSEFINTNFSSGDSFIVNFKLNNIGTGIARNIKVIPNSDNFIMIGSNLVLLDNISPDDSKSFNVSFIVKDSLNPDTYKFPITLEYIDEQGTKHEQSFDLGVDVLEKAELGIQSLKINPEFPTLADKIHMEGILENIGAGDADNVVIELITPKGNSYKTFIGQLESDDDSPFYFNVNPESPGSQEATLRITFSDDFGEHSFDTKITQDVKRPTNKVFTILFFVGLIALGIWYFHFRKKEKK